MRYCHYCLAIYAVITARMSSAHARARQRRKGQPIDSRGVPLPSSPFGPGSTFFSFKQSIFPTHELITICGIPKVGITELRSGLANHIRVPHTLPPPSEWPENINKRGDGAVTSVLIRGPFSRFVSWYRSKVLMDISQNGAAVNVTKPRKSAVAKKITLVQRDRRSLFTGAWNVHLLDSASDANITIYPIDVYIKALFNKGDDFRRKSLDPHLMTQTQLCLLDDFDYDVVGSLENIPRFVSDLKRSAGVPESILVPDGFFGANVVDNCGADGQDCKRLSRDSYDWSCSKALKHEVALHRHNNFTWSHHHANKGAQTWEQELSCEMRLWLYEIYASDFKELARLGFNYTKDLCVRDGGESSAPRKN